MSKQNRLLVRVDDWLLKEINKKLKKEHITISEVLRLLLTAWVKGNIIIKVENKQE